MHTNYLDVPEVREFFQAQAEVERRRDQAAAEQAQKVREQRRAVQDAERERERVELNDALNAVRERNAAQAQQRKRDERAAHKGKYANLDGQAFRAAIGRDFGVYW